MSVGANFSFKIPTAAPSVPCDSTAAMLSSAAFANKISKTKLPHLDKACGQNKFSCGETASWHSQFPNGSMQAKKQDRPDPAFCCLPLIYVLRCNKEYSNSYWKEQKWVGGPKTLGVPGLHSILEKIANLSNGE